MGACLAITMAMWAQHRPALSEPTADTPGRILRSHPAAGTAGAIPPRPHRRDRHRRRGPSIKLISAWEITAPRARVCLQILGWSALGVGVALWTRLTGPSSFMFEGGYFVYAIGVATVIFCAITAQEASLSRALGNPVFRYVGKISYGTYLWHFPLFALLDAARIHLYGYPLLTVRIAVTLLVATGSFYLVEEPIRRGRMRTLTEWKAWLTTSAAFLTVVMVTIMATVPSSGRGRRHVSGGWHPIQRTAGQGGHLRGLGGLATRVCHAGQPASEQL